MRHGTPTRITRAALLALPLAALLACGDSTGPGDDTTAQDAILFVRGDAEGDIYSVNVDGTGLVNLTDHPAGYAWLRLSPDGRRVVFSSDRSGCYDIWVMQVDGTGLRQLTGVDEFERCNNDPRWSPDGSLIAFYTSRDARDGKGWDAYVVRPDGSDVVDVGNNPSTEIGSNDDTTHGWSADGRVVVHSDRDGAARTYLANPDGSGLELFMDEPAWPHWSPDGSKVLCQLEEQENDLEIWVMNADGSGMTNLSSDPGRDAVAATSTPWSPDGTRVVFQSGRSGHVDFWAVNADGTGLVNLSDSPSVDTFLSWSPDGSRLLFQSRREGRFDLYLADADGTNVVRLTDHPLDDRQGVWVPASAR